MSKNKFKTPQYIDYIISKPVIGDVPKTLSPLSCLDPVRGTTANVWLFIIRWDKSKAPGETVKWSQLGVHLAHKP